MGVISATSSLNGGVLHYLTAGSGDKAVVCVHGLGQSSFIWESVLGALPSGWQGYALDLLGFGESTKPESGYSIDSHARTVASFIATIPQEDVVLAANSLGGVIALVVALNEPPKLAAMVLAATGARVRDPEALKLYRDRLATMKMTEDNRLSIARAYCYKQQDPSVLNRLADEVGKARREAMLETMSSSLSTDLRAQLPRINHPTLVVQGMEDKGRTPEDGLEIARGVKNGRLLALPDVGHTPMLDDPEEFQWWLNGSLGKWF